MWKVIVLLFTERHDLVKCVRSSLDCMYDNIWKVVGLLFAGHQCTASLVDSYSSIDTLNESYSDGVPMS